MAHPGLGSISLKLGELRLPAAIRFSLTDPAGVEQAASAIVDMVMDQLEEVARRWLRLRPQC